MLHAKLCQWASHLPFSTATSLPPFPNPYLALCFLLDLPSGQRPNLPRVLSVCPSCESRRDGEICFGGALRVPGISTGAATSRYLRGRLFASGINLSSLLSPGGGRAILAMKPLNWASRLWPSPQLSVSWDLRPQTNLQLSHRWGWTALRSLCHSRMNNTRERQQEGKAATVQKVFCPSITPNSSSRKIKGCLFAVMCNVMLCLSS